MLYLSQFVFQSILFSKKKEHAGDSGHPPVLSEEGAALLPHVARAALTSPSLALHPQPAAGCPASWRESCYHSATQICLERELSLLVTPPENLASKPVPAFSEASGPGQAEAGGAARQATWQGLSFPVTPAPSLPGSVRGSCPQNPRPSILNLKISFIIRQGI